MNKLNKLTQILNQGTNVSLETRYTEIEEWVQGFEKRQRENLADFKKAIKERPNDPLVEFWKSHALYIKIEILGDSSE